MNDYKSGDRPALKESPDEESALEESPGQVPDIAGSPSGQSNSSSLDRNHSSRVVELIQDTEYNSENDHAEWIIRPEFYTEDVLGGHGPHLSADEVSDEELDFYLNGLEEVEEEDEGDNISMDGDDDDEDERAARGLGDDDDDDDDILPDFVIAPDDQWSSSEDSVIGLPENPNYDISLPASHRYLGQMEEFRGRQVLLENSIVSLPLVKLNHIVLFPGQVLPLSTSNLSSRIEAFLTFCLARGFTTIGLMSSNQSDSIGTTAEIRNFTSLGDDLKLILEGRQRFKLLAAPFETTSEGEVRILPEIILGSPFCQINSLKRFTTHQGTPANCIISKHPHWLLRRYEASSLTQRIMAHVKDWCKTNVTQDPNDFSYWLTSNLPISNSDRMKVLSLNCAEARLLWVLDRLEKSDVFGCAECENVLCNKTEVFLMSRSGPQCSFVNQGGYVHDTLTVRSARGLILDPFWTEEYSWFPGYSWRTAHCDRCNRHIGWCFKCRDGKIKPTKFFGLSRANVRLLETPPCGAGQAPPPQPPPPPQQSSTLEQPGEPSLQARIAFE